MDDGNGVYEGGWLSQHSEIHRRDRSRLKSRTYENKKMNVLWESLHVLYVLDILSSSTLQRICFPPFLAQGSITQNH